MNSTESIKTAIYDAIVAATSSEKGRITHSELETKFGSLWKHSIDEGEKEAADTLRKTILKIGIDPQFGIVAEDVNGYFVPRSFIEAERNSRELTLETNAMVGALRAEAAFASSAVTAFHQRLAPDSAAADLNPCQLEAVTRSHVCFDCASAAVYPNCRILVWDEVIQQGDEFTPDEGQTWFGSHLHGETVQMTEVANYRRKINPGENFRLLSAGEIIAGHDEVLICDRWEPAGDYCTIGDAASIEEGILRRSLS